MRIAEITDAEVRKWYENLARDSARHIASHEWKFLAELMVMTGLDCPVNGDTERYTSAEVDEGNAALVYSAKNQAKLNELMRAIIEENAVAANLSLSEVLSRVWISLRRSQNGDADNAVVTPVFWESYYGQFARAFCLN